MKCCTRSMRAPLDQGPWILDLCVNMIGSSVISLRRTSSLLHRRAVEVVKDMSLPLPYGNTLNKEASNLGARATGRLANAEPGVHQSQTRGAGVNEADHGTKAGVIVQVRGGEGECPGDKVEDDDGGGHDLVLILADSHLTSDCVGQGTDSEVVTLCMLAE